jgi:hypothetical protein
MRPVKSSKLAEEADLKKDLADDATKKKIKKHLSDINDEISEEDIRNVKVPGKDSRENKNKKTEDEELPLGEDEKKYITPWNTKED